MLGGYGAILSYLVVDGFCPDIDRVVTSAFEAGFDTWNPNRGEVGSSVYDGMGFWGDHARMLKALMHVVGGPVLPNTMYFRATRTESEPAYIHSDRATGSSTCVCYLTEHADEYGTAFYRHKPTGLLQMPSFAEMRENGTLDELKADMVSRDPDKWERVDFVQGRKNRALIFPSPLFHSRLPVTGFGDTLEMARIIWASHFYRLNDAIPEPEHG